MSPRRIRLARGAVAALALGGGLAIAPSASAGVNPERVTCFMDYTDDASEVRLIEEEGLFYYFRARGPAEAVCDGEPTTVSARVRGRINLVPVEGQKDLYTVRGRMALSFSRGGSPWPTIVASTRGAAMCDDDGTCAIRATVAGTTPGGQQIIAILIGLLRQPANGAPALSVKLEELLISGY